MPLSGVVAGVIALNLLGGSAMAAPASAPKPQDVKAARTVVRAITRFDQTAVRHEGAMTAAAKALVAQAQAGCAGGIPASIANGTAQQQAVAFDLIFEGAFDLSIDALHPVVHPARGALTEPGSRPLLQTGVLAGHPRHRQGSRASSWA